MHGRYLARGEMSPEQLRIERRRQKYQRTQREIGKPLLILPHEFEEIKAKIVDFHSRGMGYAAMSAQTGGRVVRHCFGDVASGRQKGLRRVTYDAMKNLRYEEPEGGGTNGAALHVCRAYRRIEALRAEGYPKKFLAEWLGTFPSNIDFRISRDDRVYPATLRKIEDMYEKLKDRKPSEFGITDSVTVTRMATLARKHRWPGVDCWDDDTIDDPDAFPEWTGVCGTEEGYRVHIRETFFGGRDIPPCGPCRDAVETRPVEAPDKWLLRRDKMTEAMERCNRPMKAVAREVLGEAPSARDTLYSWRAGTRHPRKYVHVERLAIALGVEVDDLVDRQKMDELANRPLVGHGKFNPYVLSVALDLAGLGPSEAGKVAALDPQTLSKWARGVRTPSSPDKLIKLAEHFGVPVEVFYT